MIWAAVGKWLTKSTRHWKRVSISAFKRLLGESVYISTSIALKCTLIPIETSHQPVARMPSELPLMQNYTLSSNMLLCCSSRRFKFLRCITAMDQMLVGKSTRMRMPGKMIAMIEVMMIIFIKLPRTRSYFESIWPTQYHRCISNGDQNRVKLYTTLLYTKRVFMAVEQKKLTRWPLENRQQWPQQRLGFRLKPWKLLVSPITALFAKKSSVTQRAKERVRIPSFFRAVIRAGCTESVLASLNLCSRL